MNRIDDRKNDQLREIKITPNYLKNAHGSVLIESGDTKVICTAMSDMNVPPFLTDTGKGWVTAEYSMLPASTLTRKRRDSSSRKVDGRSTEIQRLIGRALRSIVNFEALGERTIWIDCDVIQADGGTRTASITGGFIALALCIEKLMKEKHITINPLNGYVAAVSAGILEEGAALDLCYKEDSSAIVDMNVVMTDKGEFIEVQGTGEGRPFSNDELAEILNLCQKGINDLINEQKNIITLDQLNELAAE